MKIIKITTIILCAAAISMTQGFAADTTKTKKGPINAICPIKGKDVKVTVPVKVSFCCKKCKAKFNKAPASYFKKLATTKAGMCPVSGKEVDEAQKSILRVGVCCKGCAKKVKTDPYKYLGKLKLKKADDKSDSDSTK